MDETNVVPELDLEDAISYTKGCYIGQEIIIRIKHRGHPAKKLCRLTIDGDHAGEDARGPSTERSGCTQPSEQRKRLCQLVETRLSKLE